MKIGIVGHGSIGRRHAANAVKLGHEIIVYDPNGSSTVKLEREVYDKADAVIISTPSPYHEGPLRACIERGKPALVEKPISVSRGALAGLLLMAEEQKLVVMMGNNLRFHTCVQEARRWLDAETIGKPIWAQFTCATKATKPGNLSDGVILNTGSHEVDLAMHLLGPAKVLIATEHRDIADFVLQHKSGVRSAFHLDFSTDKEIREFRIVGTEGWLHCDLPSRLLYRQQADFKLPAVFHISNYKGLGSYDDDYIAELTAFVQRIKGRETLGASGMDGYVTLQVLLDVIEKAKR